MGEIGPVEVKKLPRRAARGVRRPVEHALAAHADRVPARAGYPWARNGSVDVEHLIAWAYGVQLLDANPVTGLHPIEAEAAGFPVTKHSNDGCWAIDQRHLLGAQVDVSTGPTKESFHPAALAVGEAVARSADAELVREWARIGGRPDGWRAPDQWIRPRAWKDEGVTGATEHASPKVSFTPVRLPRSAASLALARATYARWHDALTCLWLHLASRALEFVVMPPAAPAEPWKIVEDVRPAGSGDATFDLAVSRAKPTLIVFVASWCSPSRALSAAAAEMVKALADVASLAVVDVDAAPATASRANLTGLPTLCVYRRGRCIASRVGGLSRRALREWTSRALDEKSD